MGFRWRLASASGMVITSGLGEWTMWWCISGRYPKGAAWIVLARPFWFSAESSMVVTPTGRRRGTVAVRSGGD